MELLFAGLAVYKAVQLFDALTPREAMPWVKLCLSIALSYVAAIILQMDEISIIGLTIATVAGSVHAVLRLVTLIGDYFRKRSIR